MFAFCPEVPTQNLLRTQPREYTVPYPVPELTFGVKRVHRGEVVIMELGDGSILNTTPEKCRKLKKQQQQSKTKNKSKIEK